MWNHQFVPHVLITAVVLLRLQTPQIVTGLALPSSQSQPQSQASLSSVTTRNNKSSSNNNNTAELSTASISSISISTKKNKNSSNNDKNSSSSSSSNNNDNELENQVILAIKNVVSTAPTLTKDPKHFFSTVGEFGKCSGLLITEKWLTPESLDECVLFWDDGYRILMRDLFRSYLFSTKSTKYKGKDWAALGWFTVLASSSSILFLPLLLPLIHIALEGDTNTDTDKGDSDSSGSGGGIDESVYIPPSFRSTRLQAMRRLRRPKERSLHRYLDSGTPRNVQEGISFFKDGTLLLVRDIKRGTLISRTNKNNNNNNNNNNNTDKTENENDTWSSYGWFAFLAFSSFPLTPLLIPLIDKRRKDDEITGQPKTSDYVPSSFRPKRLKAVARLRDLEEYVKYRSSTSAIDILRAVATNTGTGTGNTDGNENENEGKKKNRQIPLPPPESVLEAILKVQQQRQWQHSCGGVDNSHSKKQNTSSSSSTFLEALAGVSGRRWELAYIAGKPAVIAMRKQIGVDRNNNNNNNATTSNSDGGGSSWYRPLEKLLLPWTRLRDGIYIDSKLVSAIQNFDEQTMQNKNGVFSLFNSDFFQTTVEGPFSWDGQCNKKEKEEEEKRQGDNGDGDSDGSNSNSKRKRNKNQKKKKSNICAFRPTKATFQVGPWWTINQDLPEEIPFDQTHIRDLPFFKFIHVDDKVAVAMGRSGSVALWTRMNESND